MNGDWVENDSICNIVKKIIRMGRDSMLQTPCIIYLNPSHKFQFTWLPFFFGQLEIFLNLIK